MPNLGRFDATKKTTWDDVLRHFRGSELQNYFTSML
jgi:ATP-binding cassette subfamily E protein 1